MVFDMDLVQYPLGVIQCGRCWSSNWDLNEGEKIGRQKLAVLPSVKLMTFTLKIIDEQLQVRGFIPHITTMLTLTHHCHGAFGSA
jgi:hypothetical protein